MKNDDKQHGNSPNTIHIGQRRPRAWVDKKKAREGVTCGCMYPSNRPHPEKSVSSAQQHPMLVGMPPWHIPTCIDGSCRPLLLRASSGGVEWVVACARNIPRERAGCSNGAPQGALLPPDCGTEFAKKLFWLTMTGGVVCIVTAITANRQ